MPAGQAWHEAEPLAAKVPGLQRLHTDEPAREELPPGHAEQLAAPADENEPAAQGVHEPDMPPLLNVPAAHALQVVPSR
ncbi:MAG: hypothetical protein ACKO1L_04180 [Brachymonas sp.]